MEARPDPTRTHPLDFDFPAHLHRLPRRVPSLALILPLHEPETDIPDFPLVPGPRPSGLEDRDGRHVSHLPEELAEHVVGEGEGEVGDLQRIKAGK